MLVLYRHIVIEDPLPAPTPEELAAVEREVGVALPADFAEFLTLAHGGTVEYLFDADGEEIPLGSIFRAGGEDTNEHGYGTLLGELRQMRAYQGLPKQVLPFAHGGGDVPVYLDLTSEGKGRVVAFLRGLPEWTGLRRYSAFIPVAPSFDAFMNVLRLDEENAMENLQNALVRGDKVIISRNVDYLNLALPDWKIRYPELAQLTANALKN